MIEVDVRGLSCPIPVVKTKKAFEENPEAEVIVLIDTKVSVENVSRLAESRGYSATLQKEGDGYRLLLSPRSERE
jgi:tRNA 2-thiouridine synthesizing protein A